MALDRAVLAAHARGDCAALVTLYAQAAEGLAPQNAAFYLTHAYIFALEAGDPRADTLRDRLVAMGADQPHSVPGIETG
ncbi:hypothetical protein V8J82_17830 [Gymnodinialimonas sp. 2305UL16-5]|uniref:hypothetical protein n=1 Tax=Gymnodinialimonas mytili TaxID=3126503 RepID=UPI003098A2B0